MVGTMAYYPPPPVRPADNRSTVYGVVGIVGAFCCLPIGLVFGILAVRAARRTGRAPTLGYIAIGLSIAVAVVHLIVWVDGGYRVQR
jgi:hypothetical protein